MRRLLLALLTLVVVLATVGDASANRLSLSEKGFRLTWPTEEPLVVRKAAEELGLDDLLHCPVTLEGSFHSTTLRKVVGALVGQIYRAATGSCAYERSWFEPVTLLPTLPWHVRYESFSGTLPRITSLRWRIPGFAFLGVERGIQRLTCLWSVTEASPLVLRATRELGGALTGATLEGTVSRVTGQAMFCNQGGTLSGVPTLRAAGGSALTLTLI